MTAVLPLDEVLQAELWESNPRWQFGFYIAECILKLVAVAGVEHGPIGYEPIVQPLHYPAIVLVEDNGIEPLTYWLQTNRSPS